MKPSDFTPQEKRLMIKVLSLAGSDTDFWDDFSQDSLTELGAKSPFTASKKIDNIIKKLQPTHGR